VAEDTQADIAADLGVSEYLVSKAKDELEQDGKQFGQKSLSTEEKRAEVRAAAGLDLVGLDVVGVLVSPLL